MKAMAWAVLCKDGDIHADDEGCCVCLYKDQAQDALRELALELCGPHRVVALYSRG